MNTVTQVGDPSYTSGIHMWNGTAPNLNPTPTMRKAMPNTRPMLCASAVHGARDRREFQTAGHAIDDGHAVQQRAGCHGAQHEVLDGRFGCDAGVAVERHHGVQAQRHQFQAQVQGDQAARGDQHHGAQGGEQPQHVVLALEDRAALADSRWNTRTPPPRQQRDDLQHLRHAIQLRTVRRARRSSPTPGARHQSTAVAAPAADHRPARRSSAAAHR